MLFQQRQRRLLFRPLIIFALLSHGWFINPPLLCLILPLGAEIVTQTPFVVVVVVVVVAGRVSEWEREREREMNGNDRGFCCCLLIGNGGL